MKTLWNSSSKLKINLLYLLAMGCFIIPCMAVLCKALGITKYENMYLLYYSEFTYTFFIIPVSYILYQIDNRYYFHEYIVTRYSKNVFFLKRWIFVLVESFSVSLTYALGFVILQLFLLGSINLTYLGISLITCWLGICLTITFALAIKISFNIKGLDFLFLMIIVLVDFASTQAFIKTELDIVLNTMTIGKLCLINQFNAYGILPSVLFLGFIKILILFAFGCFSASRLEVYHG